MSSREIIDDCKDTKTGLWRTVPTPRESDGNERWNNKRQYFLSWLGRKELWGEFAEEVIGVVEKNFTDESERKQKKLLDIGCGIGVLVDLAEEKGFEAMGIDVSKEAIRAARENFKGKFVVGKFEKYRFREKFDVIVLNHILEHISEPMEFLAKTKNLLTKKGIVVICSPNYDSLTRWIFGNRWYGLQPTQHVWQLTIGDTKRLLERCGFRVIAEYPSSLDYRPRNPVKKLVFDLLIFVSKLINKGDQMLIVASR